MLVNGERIILAEALSLEGFLLAQGYAPEKIAVELNGEIVPRRRYPSVILKDADKLEVVCFVGGG